MRQPLLLQQRGKGLLVHVVQGSRVHVEEAAIPDGALASRSAAADGTTLPPALLLLLVLAVEVDAADDVDGVDGVEVGIVLNRWRLRPRVGRGAWRPGVPGCGVRPWSDRGPLGPGISGGPRPGISGGPRPGISGDPLPGIFGGHRPGIFGDPSPGIFANLPRPRVRRGFCP